MPSPSQMSSRTHEGRSVAARCRHSSPDTAVATRSPSSSRTTFNVSRMPASSSTIRTVFCIFQLSVYRQLDRKSCAVRVVRRNIYSSMMLGNDPFDYRQAETRAATFGREIWQKQLLKVLCSDTTAVIRDLRN